MTQLQAIIGSCLKWWRIRYDAGRDGFSNDCPLCKKYNPKGSPTCGTCPVKKSTGKDGCIGSPWTRTPTYYDSESSNRDKRAVIEELQFLFNLIKPRYYPSVKKELAKDKYPKKFVRWMERAIIKKETT
jgi:hypothetical protein